MIPATMAGADEVEEWTRFLQGIGRVPDTLRTARRILEEFLGMAWASGIRSLYQVGKGDFRVWLDGEVVRKKKSGEVLDRSTIRHRISFIRSFYRFLFDKGKVLVDPTEGFPRFDRGKLLPRRVLSRREVEKLVGAPDLETNLGSRDRAILELLYSTGLRRGEVAKLEVDDIDFRRGLVRVAMAKNKVGRLVAVGLVALSALDQYLREVRPILAAGRRTRRRPRPTTALFLAIDARPLSAAGIRLRVKKYVKESSIRAEHSTHSLRHTCATHMLEGGASVRMVAEQLGHRSLASTVVYTRVTPRHLAKVVAEYHPGAKRKEAVAPPPVRPKGWLPPLEGGGTGA